MGLNRAAEPATEPVTLEEVKAQCRVTHNGEDALLTNLRIAARQYCEEYTQRAFITQTWFYVLKRFPPNNGRIIMPRPRLQAIEDISYFDENRDEQSLGGSDGGTMFSINNTDGLGYIYLLEGQDWPDVDAANGDVTIEFTAGWLDATYVPQAIKQAILMLCSHWYKYREPVDSMNVNNVRYAVEDLLSPYVVLNFCPSDVPLGAVA